MACYTLSFPSLAEAGPYEWLNGEDEIREAVAEECEKDISDLGSDGYDLVYPDWAPKPIGIWLDSLPDHELETITMRAHEAGIKYAAAPHVERIMADFGNVLSGFEVDNTSKLPSGVTIALTEDWED